MFRVAHVLQQLEYLSRDDTTRRFTLTNKLLQLGSPSGGSRGLVESSLPAMRGLLKATKETTQLCCLSDKENVVLEQLISTHPFKYTTALGARVPCYSCAPGKAMVACLPREEQDDLLKRLAFKKFTATTITSRSAFRRELAQIQRDGYSVDRAEGLDGIHCVAAAIRDRHGQPVGALTIAGPMSRLAEPEFPRLGAMLIAAARAVEANYNA